MAGWTINLTGTTGSGASVNESTTTGAGGYYEFTDLEPGTYAVAEVGQNGWTQSYPAPPGTHTSMTLTSGDEPQGPYNFANWRPGKIEGDKWKDLNANGVWDFGEPVVTTGIEITLTGTDGSGSSVNGDNDDRRQWPLRVRRPAPWHLRHRRDPHR